MFTIGCDWLDMFLDFTRRVCLFVVDINTVIDTPCHPRNGVSETDGESAAEAVTLCERNGAERVGFA